MPEPTGEAAAGRDSQDGYLVIERKIFLASEGRFLFN
jgi:hypothetical protein